jgi:DNA-binding NarL/FixJ family response regulator
VVIIDDDPDVRALVRGVLQSESAFEVVAEFCRGRDALRTLSCSAYDIALVDIGLPDISGLDVIRGITETCPDTEVLVLTTFGDDETVVRAVSAGAGGYLLKGAPPDEFLRDLRALREGGSPISPAVARKLIRTFKSSNPPSSTDPSQESLTSRELEVLQLTSRGLRYNEIAEVCGVKVGTIHSHMKSIYRKLAVHSKTEAVFEARVRRLIRD